jgi:hypothetical protein
MAKYRLIAVNLNVTSGKYGMRYIFVIYGQLHLLTSRSKLSTKMRSQCALQFEKTPAYLEIGMVTLKAKLSAYYLMPNLTQQAPPACTEARGIILTNVFSDSASTHEWPHKTWFSLDPMGWRRDSASNHSINYLRIYNWGKGRREFPQFLLKNGGMVTPSMPRLFHSNLQLREGNTWFFFSPSRKITGCYVKLCHNTSVLYILQFTVHW